MYGLWVLLRCSLYLLLKTTPLHVFFLQSMFSECVLWATSMCSISSDRFVAQMCWCTKGPKKEHVDSFSLSPSTNHKQACLYIMLISVLHTSLSDIWIGFIFRFYVFPRLCRSILWWCVSVAVFVSFFLIIFVTYCVLLRISSRIVWHNLYFPRSFHTLLVSSEISVHAHVVMCVK